jgi:predicted RNA polymerase sigma factor
VAIAEKDGAAAGLAALPEAGTDSRLAEYQPYWATRAELLARTGAHDEARQAYEIAIGLERDAAVRRFLQERQATLTAGETKVPNPQ